mgnify:CR=1 FL=1
MNITQQQSLLLLLFVLLTIVCVFLLRRFSNQQTVIPNLINALLESLFIITCFNDRLIVVVKDGNCKYIAFSNSLLSRIYRRQNDNVEDKNEYEICTGKKLDFIDTSRIRFSFDPNSKTLKCYYEGLENFNHPSFISDLIVLKQKTSFRFLELLKDDLLLDTFKFPVLNKNREVEFIVCLSLVVNGENSKDLFMTLRQHMKCLNSGREIIGRVENSDLLIIDKDLEKQLSDTKMLDYICVSHTERD